MALSELLNPQSEQEEREFLGHLHKPQRSSSSSILPALPTTLPPLSDLAPSTSTGHEGYEEVLLLLQGHAQASSSAELLPSLATPAASALTALPQGCSEHDTSSATFASSDCEGGGESLMDTDLEEEEEEEEEEETETEGSPTPSRLLQQGARGSLYQQKTERIALKVRRLLAGNSHMVNSLLAGPAIVDGEVHAALAALPELKVMKKTVNQTTATVAYLS